jgi:hypothetical protein
MFLQQFDILESLEKIDLLADEGIMLAFRIEGSFQISLYQLDSFYAEVYFHTGQNTIRFIRSFEDTAQLSTYLEKIDISELIKGLETE